jgi:hypothetical protein
MHNCITCKDSSVYCHYPYSATSIEGNCLRCPVHKCGIRPYYHNYSLAEDLGIDEDSCGEDCDICLDNFKCPEHLPFYMVATRECVEICGFNEIMAQTCFMNQTNALDMFIKDPFNITSTHKELNQYENLVQLIFVSIYEKYSTQTNVNVKNVQNTINNYVKDGKIFNLPNSQIIIGNNISIELTTTELELLKLLAPKTETKTETKMIILCGKNNMIVVHLQ